MKNRQAAFTLMELLVTMLVASAVGAIIYTVASEGVSSFARNASLNRTYTDARGSIDQITTMIQSAPNTPQPLDANGVPTSGQSAGIRFYRYFTLPNYTIPSGKTTDSTLTIQYTGNQVPVNVGDMATIPLLGFQDTVTGFSGTPTTNGDGSKNVTFTFAKAIYLNCSPTLPVDSSKNTIPINFTASGTNPVIYYSCLAFRQVAVIAVPNAAGGADLRYYPQAMSSNAVAGNACGNLAAFNNSTAFNTAKNFSVMATIPGNVTDATVTPLKPFLVNASYPSILGVTLCTTNPDYTNRSSLRASNTYSLMRSSMASRSPILLHPMTVPF